MLFLKEKNNQINIYVHILRDTEPESTDLKPPITPHYPPQIIV